jgi:hypothetical protein
MNENIKWAIDAVYKELLALNPEEFRRMLSKHQDGDIAKIILEADALIVGEIETEGFSSQDFPYTVPVLHAQLEGNNSQVDVHLNGLWCQTPLLSSCSIDNLYELDTGVGN